MSTNDTQREALHRLVKWALATTHEIHFSGDHPIAVALEALASRQDQQGQAFAWEATTPVYKRFVTQAWYDKARPAVKRWYKPYRCSACAAPLPHASKETAP